VNDCSGYCCHVVHGLERGHGDESAASAACKKADPGGVGGPRGLERPVSRLSRTGRGFCKRHGLGAPRPSLTCGPLRVDPDPIAPVVSFLGWSAPIGGADVSSLPSSPPALRPTLGVSNCGTAFARCQHRGRSSLWRAKPVCGTAGERAERSVPAQFLPADPACETMPSWRCRLDQRACRLRRRSAWKVEHVGATAARAARTRNCLPAVQPLGGNSQLHARQHLTLAQRF
jgi:hypothetical protein